LQVLPEGTDIFPSTVKFDFCQIFNLNDTFQTLNYIPDISHHERKLFCIYSQADENGRELVSKEDHITLSIFYLEEPAEGKRELPEAEVSQQVKLWTKIDSLSKRHGFVSRLIQQYIKMM